MLGRTPSLLKIQAGYLKSFVEHLGTRLVGFMVEAGMGVGIE